MTNLRPQAGYLEQTARANSGPVELVALHQFRRLNVPHYWAGGIGGGKARNGSTEEPGPKMELKIERVLFLYFLINGFFKI